ncbi:hypothetical protein CYJ46_11880 [Corynebacterium coyleae]|nr:hypothetical protein CYJ46_11880 [Corynebacterium coyleae]
MRKAFTGQYSFAIRDWARAIANRVTGSAENSTFYSAYGMSMRDVLFAVSLDFGWSVAECDAVEIAARQLAQKMIDEAAG